MTMLLNDLNQDAKLLMYLAGELPDEDRLHLEHLLAGDAALRRSLGELQEAYGGLGSALRSADASQRLAFPAATAARRFGQQVRSWHARNRSLAPTATPSMTSRRLPRWAYPIASAAAVLIAFFWWHGANSDAVRSVQTDPARTPPVAAPAGVPERAPSDQSSTDLYAYDAGAWSGANVLAEPAENQSDLALSEAEAELYALSDPTDDDDDLSTFLMLGDVDEQ